MYVNIVIAIAVVLPPIKLSPVNCVSVTVSTANIYNNLRVSDPASLVKGPQLHKTKGAYSVPIAGKKSIFLKDVFPKDDEEGIKYKYLGYIKSMSGFLFLKRSVENYAYVLVYGSGIVIELRGPLAISPNQENIVVLSAGLENEVFPNSVQIFKWYNGTLSEKCDLRLARSEPEEIRWITNNTFMLKAHTVNSDGIPLNNYVYTKYIIF